MIGQHIYYLNNKTYITNIENLNTLIFEVKSYYHTKSPRRIRLVHPKPMDPDTPEQLVEAQYENIVEQEKIGSSELLSFMQWNEVDIDFIQNSDKFIMVFTHETDMLEIFARYTAGLLHASGFYADHADTVEQITAKFLAKVTESDHILTWMAATEVYDDIESWVNTMFETETRFDVTYQNGKNFSYDLLFFLNDYYRCDAVQNLIVEKFTIHSNDMARDVMEHFTSRRHYMSYILSVIDWMNANATDANGYATDKMNFIHEVYISKANTGQYVAAFYQLEELWNKVKDDPAFLAAHQAKVDAGADGWEYMDLYTEFKNAFPIVRKVLERSFDMDNLTADLRLINTDVQFFSKRQNRIPYLIHKYPLT